MIDLEKRIKAFDKLGIFLSENKNELTKVAVNPWFTEDNVEYAINVWAEQLKYEKITDWVKSYPNIEQKKDIKKIAVITAGNLPLVEFHDFLSVLIAGHSFYGKLSSKNNRLLPSVAKLLTKAEPAFAEYIKFEEDNIENFDAVIATGSNNSARYFEHYFGKYPHIIRKNRNSVAVLSGKETNEELKLLADDIFLYFGLGCRNVSKLFIPADFELNRIFANVLHKQAVINHNKYANNYDYNRAVYLMNQEKFLDNGFMLMKESNNFSSPISVIYYERYENLNDVKNILKLNTENLQCVVSRSGFIDNCVPFGESQKPTLSDYADQIDTLEFLLN